jgi:N-acetylmuramic acid 6-phosphate etherase
MEQDHCTFSLGNGIDHLRHERVDSSQVETRTDVSDELDGPRATGLDELATEVVSACGGDYELRSTLDLVARMNDEDAVVAAAVRAASTEIAALVDAVVERLRGGGRLIYIGAGSSGWIAALDAAECESTFSAEPGQVIALVAGSELDSREAQEAAEDDLQAGAEAIGALVVTAADAVVGVSASGRTPYVLGAMAAAAAAGAVTAAVVSVRESEVASVVEHEVPVLVGPEFLAGSTRLKSGTAQKLVLNMLSTISMIRLGKTFGNLMVDVSATNEKLRARVRRIVGIATGAPEAAIDAALAASNGSARVAIVSLLAGIDAETARDRLRETNDSIRRAVE